VLVDTLRKAITAGRLPVPKKKRTPNHGPTEAQQVEQIAVSNGEITIFTPAELRRLLLAAQDDFLPALAIGAFAGPRSTEVQRLTWEDVNLEESRIDVKKGKSKTSSRRVVPILPALATWLKPYASANGLVAPFTHAGFYNSQRDTARATATESEPTVQWKSNALRHSFISFRLAIVEDQNKVALESGNSPAMIHRHYKQPVSAKMAKEWFQLDRESVGQP
jgi:integrase